MDTSREILLSVCMIVRDEEFFIRQCLKSLREAADEIIVLDTGSKDRTVEIAEESGARVFHTTWENDFAKARNECLSHARGRWVLCVDADEQLDEKGILPLRSIVSGDNSNPYGISLKVLNYTSLELENKAVVHFAPRLFPRLSTIEFRGRLHEQLWNLDTDSALPLIKCDEIVLHHYGYDKSIIAARDKFGRNEEMSLRAIEEEPDNYFHYYNYAVALLAVGRTYDALTYFDKAATILEHKEVSNHLSTIYLYMADIYLRMEEPHKALQYCNKALDRRDTYYDVYYKKGCAHRRLNEIGEALEAFHRACFDNRNDSLSFFRVIRPEITRYLALLEIALIHLFVKKDYAKALEYLSKIERYGEEHPPILLGLFQTSLRLNRLSDAERYCISYRQAQKDAGPVPEIELIAAYSSHGEFDSIERFVERYLQQTESCKAEALLSAADIFFRQLQYEKALRLYKIYRSRSNEADHSKELYMNMAHCCLRLSSFDEGLEYLSNARRLAPECSRAYNEAGVIHMSRNNYSEAYHCFVSALQKKPDYSIARFNLAKTEYALTNYHEALTHFDYLIAQGEYHIESLMFKSIIFYERGMYDQSIENLNRVIAEKPDSVEAYTYLARNFRKMKRHDMADKLEQSLAALAQLKMNN